MGIIDKGKQAIANFVVENSRVVKLSDSFNSYGTIDSKKQSNTGIDLKDTLPHIVNQTLENARYAASKDFLFGLIENRISKSCSKLELKDTKGTLSEEEMERINKWLKIIKIGDIGEEILRGSMIDGETYIQISIDVNTKIGAFIQPIFLEVDGINYDMIKVVDDYGKTQFYLHKIMKSKLVNEGADFDNVADEDEESITLRYEKNEIINTMFNERNNKGRSLILAILDSYYYKANLEKNQVERINRENVIEIKPQLDRDGQPLVKDMPQSAKNKLRAEYSDIGGSKVAIIPGGVESKLLGGNVSYAVNYTNQIAIFEKNILNAFNTPLSQSANESSNRATSEVTNDSEDSGFVVVLQSDREWTEKYLNTLLENQLLMWGIESYGISIEYTKSIFDEIQEYNLEKTRKEQKKEEIIEETREKIREGSREELIEEIIEH